MIGFITVAVEPDNAILRNISFAKSLSSIKVVLFAFSVRSVPGSSGVVWSVPGGSGESADACKPL